MAEICSVPGCNSSAVYEVLLYDYYQSLKQELIEQDYTCPYLCEEHMQQNEREAIGQKIARGVVKYPFSNQGEAQGYTKYKKL